MNPKSFASDNFATVHPEIMQAMANCNQGHVESYGYDPYTYEAVAKFKEHFGPDIEVYFVYNGTAANVLGINNVTESFNSIICAKTAHMNHHECNAPERLTGCKLTTIETKDGKITPEQIKPHLVDFDFEHCAQPKVISITQSTEYGNLYSPEEIQALADLAHTHDMYLHMDGARIANAAVAQELSLKEATKDLGVDILSFGGCKNGMMFGEAIVFFKPELVKNIKFFRKQHLQLQSKMRYLSVQFTALLSNDLWKRNAQQANNMAQYLGEELSKIPEIEIFQNIDTNAIFAKMPQEWIPELQKSSYFYIWTEGTNEVRLMCSFDTTKEDIDAFIGNINKLRNA
jgi:threonine aldolase